MAQLASSRPGVEDAREPSPVRRAAPPTQADLQTLQAVLGEKLDPLLLIDALLSRNDLYNNPGCVSVVQTLMQDVWPGADLKKELPETVKESSPNVYTKLLLLQLSVLLANPSDSVDEPRRRLDAIQARVDVSAAGGDTLHVEMLQVFTVQKYIREHGIRAEESSEAFEELVRFIGRQEERKARLLALLDEFRKRVLEEMGQSMLSVLKEAGFAPGGLQLARNGADVSRESVPPPPAFNPAAAQAPQMSTGRGTPALVASSNGIALQAAAQVPEIPFTAIPAAQQQLPVPAATGAHNTIITPAASRPSAPVSWNDALPPTPRPPLPAAPPMPAVLPPVPAALPMRTALPAPAAMAATSHGWSATMAAQAARGATPALEQQGLFSPDEQAASETLAQFYLRQRPAIEMQTRRPSGGLRLGEAPAEADAGDGRAAAGRRARSPPGGILHEVLDLPGEARPRKRRRRPWELRDSQKLAELWREDASLPGAADAWLPEAAERLPPAEPLHLIIRHALQQKQTEHSGSGIRHLWVHLLERGQQAEPPYFQGRTAAHLKDRYRFLVSKGELPAPEPNDGVHGNAARGHDESAAEDDSAEEDPVEDTHAEPAGGRASPRQNARNRPRTRQHSAQRAARRGSGGEDAADEAGQEAAEPAPAALQGSAREERQPTGNTPQTRLPEGMQEEEARAPAADAEWEATADATELMTQVPESQLLEEPAIDAAHGSVRVEHSPAAPPRRRGRSAAQAAAPQPPELHLLPSAAEVVEGEGGMGSGANSEAEDQGAETYQTPRAAPDTSPSPGRIPGRRPGPGRGRGRHRIDRGK